MLGQGHTPIVARTPDRLRFVQGSDAFIVEL